MPALVRQRLVGRGQEVRAAVARVALPEACQYRIEQRRRRGGLRDQARQMRSLDALLGTDVVFRADHDELGAGRRRLLAHALDHLQSVEIRQAPVHQHQFVALPGGLGTHELVDGRLGARAAVDGDVERRQDLAERGERGGVVVDDERAQAAQRVPRFRRAAAVACGRRAQREREVEGASGHERAVDVDGSAHQLHQVLADREAETRAAEAARHRVVALAKRLEQLLELLLAHADAGIADRERHLHALGMRRAERRLHEHLARGRELDGVACDVDQHLLQPHRVADEQVGHVRRAPHHHFQRLVADDGHQHVAHPLQQVVQREFRVFERQLAGLDLREVENVVDDVQQ